MKVGLITLHRVGNYGSVLQTYATQYIIQKMGYDVEVIDYYPERLHLIGMLKRIKDRGELLSKSLLVRNICRMIIFPSYIRRFKVFSDFLKRYINMSSITYNSIEELRQNPPQSDIYCTGSDQVWNSGWNEKIEYPYFLDFVSNGARCFTYAASFGKSSLDEWEKQETHRLLEKYKYISVRESAGIKILNDLDIHNAIHVLDPTLLLDKHDWETLISKKYSNKKYILLYNINRNKELDKYAKEFAKRKKLPIYYLSYNYHDIIKGGRLIACPTVEEFLSLINNAQYILTDSFHVTAFSMNFEKQILVYYPPKFSSRLESIVNLVGIQNRVIRDIHDFTISDNPIDFSNVNRVLKEQRNYSMSFLEKALSLENY
ncbi:Polysaccharide pyruvyl transferase [Clostridium sp. N3C]|uniref:polysaccharide pyruvyl transferase family protein n=1 Tax=Clostridium sp. N3C TaxID=1776758 RepID=UPI00092DFBC4|nr:polysaccharide pyruvyl transferase family protein [Clostridium sp. N3C]SCN26550.1 Polysaccharide pyruvyl transferase [Clostridium sp. N3C]